MKSLLIFSGLLSLFFLSACSAFPDEISRGKTNPSLISVVSYNAQEFFDAKNDGCEYSDFKKSGNWNTDSYKIRLERLCSIIKSLNADIYVFQEIENEAILQDLSNFLSGESWRQKDLWSYSCFAKEPGSAIGNAVFSRFPLDEVKTHHLDIRSEYNPQPSMRPILETTVSVGDKKFKLYTCHWKSKSGGQEETELWRNWQEQVLSEILYQEKEKTGSEFAALICGDFNRDILDFCLNENTDDSEGNIILRGKENQIKVHSLWLDSLGEFTCSKGSYFFQNKWERIDQIFIAGNIRFKKFEPQYNGDWADEQGVPSGYKLYTGSGFSDHLPVKAIIELSY